MALPRLLGHRHGVHARPSALFTVVLLFTWLIPYRILMVWLYDHTQSVLLAILMHVPIVVEKFVLAPAGRTSAQIAAQNLVFTASVVDHRAGDLRCQPRKA